MTETLITWAVLIIIVCTVVLFRMALESYEMHKRMWLLESLEYDRVRVRRYLLVLWTVPLWAVVSPIVLLGTRLFWVGVLCWMGVEDVLKNSLDTWKATKR